MTIAALTGSQPWLVAGWTILHFLWVGGALGLAAAATRRGLRNARPEVRYGFALSSLMVLALAPLAISWLVTVSALPGLPRVEDPAETLDPLASASATLPDQSPATSADGAVSTPDQSVLFRPVGGTILGRLLATAAARLPWLWLAGAPATFVLLAIGLVGAERLRRQSRLLTEGDLVALCSRLADALGLTRPVALGVCDRLVTPIVLGVVRPLILLPPAALTGWSPELVEMALLHELAHVQRLDILVNLIQHVVESILFFHPAVWIVSGWVRQEREHCCDRVVVDRTGRPRAYAEALFSFCSPGPTPRTTALAMARSHLVVRIRRILDPEDLSMKLPRTTLTLIVALFLIPALLIGSQVAPAGPRDREQLDSSGEQQKAGSKEQQKSESDRRMKRGFYDVDARLTSYSKFELLTQYPAVQDELKLSSTQKDGIKSIQSKAARFKDMTAKSREEIGKQADPVAKVQARRALREQAEGFYAEAETAAIRVLNGDQRRRLDEILLQAEGPLALLRADVQQRLNLDEQQIENITAIVNQGRAAMNEMEGVPPELRKYVKADPENRSKIITDPAGVEQIKALTRKRFEDRLKLRGSISREIAQVLRKQQRTLYDKMCGEPFDLMELRRPIPSSPSRPEQATKPSTDP